MQWRKYRNLYFVCFILIAISYQDIVSVWSIFWKKLRKSHQFFLKSMP